MPTTMWSASFSCWLITEAGSNRLCGGSFEFNFVVLNKWCVSMFRVFHRYKPEIMLCWVEDARMECLKLAPEQRRLLLLAAGVSFITLFCCIMEGTSPSRSSFTHQFWVFEVLKATRTYHSASAGELTGRWGLWLQLSVSYSSHKGCFFREGDITFNLLINFIRTL